MMDVTASSPKVTAVVVKLKEENINEEQKDNDEVQKKFVLPPEYDENDSRWTLKYREPAPGLVELMPHTGVYVNADKLDECERLSTVCKRLARLLLTEIFTTSALSTCSWSGATANDSNIDGEQARPGLDEHARNIMLKFVEEYGLIREWIITDYQCILNYMRQIMLEMRRVGQKEEENNDYELEEKSSHSHMRQTMLEMRRDSQKEEDYDGLLEKGSYLLMRQTMLEMRRDSQKEEDYDGLLEKGSYSPMRQTMLEMRRDSQKEDYDGLLEKDFHTRMYQIMLDIGRARLKENEDSYDEVLNNSSHTRKFVLPPEYDENDSRWTFEYREPVPGPDELREHSVVYINADKLDNCKKFLNGQSFQPREGTFLTWIKRACEKCIAAVCCMERCSTAKNLKYK